MLENPSPTGGTKPSVKVVKPLNNQPNQEVDELSTLLPQVNQEDELNNLLPVPTQEQTQQTNQEDELDNLLPENKLVAPQQQGAFDFGELVTISDKDAKAKINQRKSAQELFGKKEPQESVKIQKPFEDISISNFDKEVISIEHSPKLMPNTGEVSISQTGAPVIHKDGDLKRLKIQQYPLEVQINPDVQRTLLSFPTQQGIEEPNLDTKTAFDFINSGRVVPLSSMQPEQKEAFINIFSKDLMPSTGMVYPNIKTSSIDSDFKSLRDIDVTLNSSLTQNQEEISALSKKISEDKTEEEYNADKIKWDDLTSKDIYYNIWKGFKDKKEIYPEEIASKIQSLRNNQKYDVLKKSGFVNNVDETLPENIKDVLKSNEYINSTAKEKMVYAKQLWFTNKDKFATPEDLYGKIKDTFTPSVSLLFLVQKAKDSRNKLEKQKLSSPLYDWKKKQMFLEDKTELIGENKYLSKAIELYDKIIDGGVEDSDRWRDVKNTIQYHGLDAIPFVSSAFGLTESAKLYSIVNKEKKSGINSLSEEERTLFDAYSIFNTYNQLNAPDEITSAINAAPGIISFIGELGATKAIPSLTSGLMKTGASKAAKFAIEKSPSILASSADVLKALNYATGGAVNKLASNSGKMLTYPTGLLAQTLMARGLEATSSAINMTTDIPQVYVDYDQMKYVNENLPSQTPDFWNNLQASILLEGANIATLDAAKVIGTAQNSVITKLMSKFPEGSEGRNLLNWLKINEIESIAASKGSPTGIEAFLQRAKTFSPTSFTPDLLAFGVALPRAEHLILGTKDGLWDNPYKTIVEDIQSAAIGLFIPVMGGKLVGIGSLSNFDRIIKPNEYKFREFNNRVVDANSEDFANAEFITNLRNEADLYSKTGNLRKNRFGQILHARINDRISWENDRNTEGSPNFGAKGETYREYLENQHRSQTEMNVILERIRDGKSQEAESFLDEAIKNASDESMRQQFEFHRDLVMSYESAGRENETLKQYVDRHKKEYNSIKEEFSSLKSLRTAPNWSLYEKRINDLMMPQTYKDELKRVFDWSFQDTQSDNINLYGDAKGTDGLPEFMSIQGQDSKHTFLKKEDGTYKFVGDINTAHTDIDFGLQGIAIPDVANLYQISRNSDMPTDLKEKVSQSVKERAMAEFEDNQFFTDFGGRENMHQLLDLINTVANTSPLTTQEKQNLSNAVLNIFEVEIRRESTLENYDAVKSSVQKLIQDANIVDISNVLKFHDKVARVMVKDTLSKMTVSQLEDNISTARDNNERKLLEEEIQERKNIGKLTDVDIKSLLDKLSLNPTYTNINFDVLRRENPTVAKISDKVYELHKKGELSEPSVTLIEQFLGSFPPEYLNIKSVVLGELSSYAEKSRTITIGSTKGKNPITEQQLVAEILEEINHSVQHNIANAVGNGGLIGEFILTDKQLTDICGKDRTDAITTIAKWYKGKDYDYNRFLELKGKLRSEMTEEESKEYGDIVDMLKRFALKYGQKWQDLNFVDKENKLGWSFTTEQLVRNWNRYKQMKQLTRPDGTKYTSAQAFYYSAYSHEYFARTLADYQIRDIQQRISDSPEVESMLDKTSSFLSKLKLPSILKAFRSVIFESNVKPLTDILSVADQRNIERYATTTGEALTEQQKKDFDNILKDTPEPVEKFRNLVNDTSNPQALNDFIVALINKATELGYDKGITSDLLDYLNKEIGLVGSMRDSEEDKLMYVSNTLKALEGLKIEKTSGANWLDKILSSGGKKVEIERYGLDEYLKTNKNPTKQDILEFLSDKVMKVKDVILGGKIDEEFSKLNSIIEDNKNTIESRYSINYDTIEPFTNPGVELNEKYLFNEIDRFYKEEHSSEVSDNTKFSILGSIKNIREARKELFDRNLSGEYTDSKSRWSEYTTFPLNNYRELLPVIDTEQKLFSHESHFAGIKNQLYHNRLNDVVSESGKRLLLSEEMQADWTQKEKNELPNLQDGEILKVEFPNGEIEEFTRYVDFINKIGLHPGEDSAKRIAARILLNENSEYKLLNKLDKSKTSPLTTTSDWVRAAIRRMVHLAVAEGKDGIAWTPAHLQVERWSDSMREVVKEIKWYNIDISERNSQNKPVWAEGNNMIAVDSDRGAIGTFYKDSRGEWYNRDKENIKEFFGSEMAKKILSEKEGKLEGENIIVGGEGYKDIYDKTAVNVANKFAKKYGLEVTKEKVHTSFPEQIEYRKEQGIEEQPVEVWSLVFNDKLKEDIGKQKEIEIFAKRNEPTVNHEYRNISDFIDAQNEAELLKDKVELGVGEERKRIEKEQPELFKQLLETERLQSEEYSKLVEPQEVIINAKRDEEVLPPSGISLIKNVGDAKERKELYALMERRILHGDKFTEEENKRYDELNKKFSTSKIAYEENYYGDNESNISDEVRIGAKRDKSPSPVDVSWFQSLFEDKDRIISTRDVERVIKDIDDNALNFVVGDVKTIAEGKRRASEFARNLVELWKGRVIAKELPKSSVYERKEIARLVNIPFRKKLSDYTKDIQYISEIVTNANFRKELAEVKKQQGFARNRFLRYNKDDVAFYSSVNKLTSINTRMFETQGELSAYGELLMSKPETVNIEEFSQKVDEVWNRYVEWKKQFNDQYVGEDTDLSEDEKILNEQLFYDKKQIIKEAVSTQLVNNGVTELDRATIDSFSRIDIDAMNQNEVKEYEQALKYLLLNPEKVNHKVVKLVNKYKAQEFYEQSKNLLSQKYIDIINRKSLPSTNIAVEYFKGLIPGLGTQKSDKLGNISAYNVKSIFEMAEGMSSARDGILQQGISNPIIKNYQDFLINKADAIRSISAKKKYSISQMHRVGIKALLDQKPQFAVTPNVLKFLDSEGIDISDIGQGEILNGQSTGIKAEAYEKIRAQSNQMIKESILISFGIKPDETWTDNEMKEIMGDISIMSHRSEDTIKKELDELLKDSGYDNLSDYIDNLQLDESETSYLETLRSAMNDTKEGKYSNGIGLKSASEQLQGIQFQDIENYFPLLRYKTYLTTENYLNPEANEDANNSKVFYGIYNDFQMNTSFLEKRKPTVMALQTNAYEAVAKRLDQQIFYLNHIEHQNYLKSVFRTPMFYGKSDMFNTEATNQIIELLNGDYNRGINKARAEITKDTTAKFIYGAMNRYKALYVGDWMKSPGQLSTVIFNMATMKGNILKKVSDIKVGTEQMVNSYVEGSEENLFLSKYAPEIYYRGLNTYDFIGIDSVDNFSDSGDITDKTKLQRIFSEAARNSGKVSGVTRGLERGVYRTNKSIPRNIASEIGNRYSQFGSEWNLAGLKFFDRVAARTSFFSSYKNYCDYLGVKVDFNNPNQQALNYAMESVRETQHTDNPIQKSGLSYNAIAGGTAKFPDDWTMINLLAFKSYAINERQTLMKASERLKNAVYQKNWEQAQTEASYFAYSFASKMAFNYIKLVCQKMILAQVASHIIGDGSDSQKSLAKESIGTWANLDNVALRSLLDYFTLAEPVKAMASLGLKYVESELRDRPNNELSPEEAEKYKGTKFDPNITNAFASSVTDDLLKSTSDFINTNKEYGAFSKEAATDDARFLLMWAQMRYGIPGSAILNDQLREINKQRKISERTGSTSDETEDSGIGDTKY